MSACVTEGGVFDKTVSLFAMPADVSILEGLSLGDRSAVDKLMQVYGPLVWTIARKCSDSDKAAEELTFEIFDFLICNAQSFEPTMSSERDFVRSVVYRFIFRNKHLTG